MSRGRLLSLARARARVNEIRRELREIYRTYPDLGVGRTIGIRRNATNANGDIDGGTQRPLSRQWVRRR